MNNLKIELKWAVLFILMGLVWILLEKSFGLHDKYISQHAIYTNLIALPSIAIYIFALLDKRKNFYEGKMTYLQGVFTGLIITLFVTFLTPVSQYITSMYITPEYFPNVIDYVVSSGQMTMEEAKAYFNLESYLYQSVIFAPIAGTVTTLIVAIFTRKK
ncbi:DUF4199 domain-containing protein [Belliella sp. R4-6]|uniref:DUF4199 domain-containing protein n=1 Tax=Belliella alkalica TaxID=1730871 RepID=A0ABS9VFF6_9BACT|nr:DUF4199 domain-containing protein [Belliella alkalica]MCH7415190.1 DUF4199 domain-containing protein [Belliella alkalica]